MCIHPPSIIVMLYPVSFYIHSPGECMERKESYIGILIHLIPKSHVSILFISRTCNIVDEIRSPYHTSCVVVSGGNPSWTVDLGTWQNIIGVTISKPENGKFILTYYIQKFDEYM